MIDLTLMQVFHDLLQNIHYNEKYLPKLWNLILLTSSFKKKSQAYHESKLLASTLIYIKKTSIQTLLKVI